MSKDALLKFIGEKGLVRARDLPEQLGLLPASIRPLLRSGQVVRVGRGLYSLAAADITEHHALAEACKRVPNGVVCLLSALAFHNIGTQNPPQVWLAIDGKARRPHIDYPALRIVRFPGPALTAGIQETTVEGVTVRLYSPAKTVADCFKYRNKVGLDVAIEALRECLRLRQCRSDELWEYARICRIDKVMKPYMEALL